MNKACRIPPAELAAPEMTAMFWVMRSKISEVPIRSSRASSVLATFSTIWVLVLWRALSMTALARWDVYRAAAR